MEDVLKVLLQAEQEAEKLLEQAEAERDAMIQEAKAEAQVMEKRFRDAIPEIRESFKNSAEDKAAQVLADLKERQEKLVARIRSYAAQHEREAVEKAVALLIEPGKD